MGNGRAGRALGAGAGTRARRLGQGFILAAAGIGIGGCSGGDTTGTGTGSQSAAVYTTFDKSQEGCVQPISGGAACVHFRERWDAYLGTGSDLADGNYYFVVVAPGYEKTAWQDGTVGNLSDTAASSIVDDNGRGDAVAARTFSVQNHQVVYSGKHKVGWSPDGKLAIQLWPFDGADDPDQPFVVGVCTAPGQGTPQCVFEEFMSRCGQQDGGVPGGPPTGPPDMANPCGADLNTDVANCGACGNACMMGQTCASGVCICPTGQALCNGCCVDINNNSNCGACGNTCPQGTTCVAGTCQGTCANGYSSCGGVCVDTASDAKNCGSCGNVCPPGSSCSGGTCHGPGCTSPMTSCNGVCVDTSSDAANCGACGVVCPPGTSCASGSCHGTCTSPKTTCNGVCVDTSSDPANCGACGKACPQGETCVSGGCVTTSPGPYLFYEDSDAWAAVEKQEQQSGCQSNSSYFSFNLSDCGAAAASGTIVGVAAMPTIPSGQASQSSQVQSRIKDFTQRYQQAAACKPLSIDSATAATLPIGELDDPHDAYTIYRVYYTLPNTTRGSCDFYVLGTEQDYQSLLTQPQQNQPTAIGCEVCVGDCGGAASNACP